MSTYQAFEQRYANMTFDHGTMIEPSRATIDHGRLLTIQRREKFATLSAEIRTNAWDSFIITIPNRALLSPRRIDHILAVDRRVTWGRPRERGDMASMFADEIYRLMGEWLSAGFPPFDTWTPDFEGRVADWHLRLVQS